MQTLLNQRVEKQPQKLLVGGFLLYSDSVYVGVNYDALCCVVMGCLYHPIDGNELARNTRMYPITEILRELKEQFGEEYSLQDYRAPLAQKYIVLAEHTAISLRELNDLLERLQRHLEARCYCPAQNKDFAEAGQLCQALSVKDVDFLISNLHSIVEEPGRVKILENCKRLLNKDPEVVLAAASSLYQLGTHNFLVDPSSRRGMDSRERELGASYAG